MFAELDDKPVFKATKTHALDYVATVRDRSVFPDAAAPEGLAAFDELLPTVAGDALAIVEQLHPDGSPATVATTGGGALFRAGLQRPVGLGVRRNLVLPQISRAGGSR